MSEVQSTTEYREVPEFPDYLVGSDGSVWSKLAKGDRHPLHPDWRRMSPSTDKLGRQKIDLHPGRIPWRVHRLVLTVFVGPCPKGMECCHYDGNYGNNALSNLRWDTKKSNAADTERHGRTARGEKTGTSRLTEEEVRAIREEYFSDSCDQRGLARKYGVCQATIQSIVTYQYWRHLRSERPMLSNYKNRCGRKTTRGEGNPHAKLTEAEVVAIRQEYDAGGTTYKAMAAKYGVDESTVGHIIQRKIWRHVT